MFVCLWVWVGGLCMCVHICVWVGVPVHAYVETRRWCSPVSLTILFLETATHPLVRWASCVTPLCAHAQPWGYKHMLSHSVSTWALQILILRPAKTLSSEPIFWHFWEKKFTHILPDFTISTSQIILSLIYIMNSSVKSRYKKRYWSISLNDDSYYI